MEINWLKVVTPCYGSNGFTIADIKQVCISIRHTHKMPNALQQVQEGNSPGAVASRVAAKVSENTWAQLQRVTDTTLLVARLQQLIESTQMFKSLDPRETTYARYVVNQGVY